MEIKKYKFGDTVVGIHSPVAVKDIGKYENFICENEDESFSIDLEIVDLMEITLKSVFYKTEHAEYTKANGKIYCCLFGTDINEKYYAVTETSPNENRCKIYLSKTAEKHLNSRIIFNAVSYEEISAKSNTAVMHASYIDIGGEAILFTGPCGMGKSTQADLWAKYKGAQVINGDKVWLYEKDGMAIAGALPIAGTSLYCVNRDLPIKAIVQLSQAQYNKAEELKGLNAFLAVYKSVYPVRYMPELINNQMEFTEKFVTKFKTYHLACTPDEAAVRCLEEKINAI